LVLFYSLNLPCLKERPTFFGHIKSSSSLLKDQKFFTMGKEEFQCVNGMQKEVLVFLLKCKNCILRFEGMSNTTKPYVVYIAFAFKLCKKLQNSKDWIRKRYFTYSYMCSNIACVHNMPNQHMIAVSLYYRTLTQGTFSSNWRRTSLKSLNKEKVLFLFISR